MPDRYQLMALLAAWCTMRLGELTELRRGDIVLRTAGVKVRRGVVRIDGEFIIGPLKTDAGVRDIAIPPPSCRLCRAISPTTRQPAGVAALPGCG